MQMKGIALLILCTVMWLGGCQEQAEKPATQHPQNVKKEQPTAMQMPPPTVGVLTVEPQSVTLYEHLPGRLQASREATVRARVDGIVQQRLFREGAEVKAGALLYRIDDALYRATLSSAQAQRAQATAAYQLAVSTLHRYAPLVRAKAISKQQYEQARSQKEVAQANISAADAAIQQAKLRLHYTEVTAPISGRIGPALVNEGALVSAAQGTALATIQQVNPLKILISQPAGKVIALKQALARGGMQSPRQLNVDVLLDDGTLYPQQGKLLFSGQTVDPNTGEITLQAELPNPDNLLLPGLYVRVSLPTALLKQAFLIPQQAVVRSERGNTVLVVQADHTFVSRQVQIAQAQGDNWVVTSGLHAGEQVIVDGQMGLRGAKTVNPIAWSGTAVSSAASAHQH